MSESESYSPNNFILRITREEWFKQVFKIKKYYPGIGRHWEAGGVILLARKTENGDSFVGYGVLEKFVERNQLPEKERVECENMGWKGVLVFEELYKFEPPLPIKETFLSGSNARGRCLHGYPLTQKQVKSILDKAKEYSAFNKVN
ncbi:MAG: hypothetical protein QXH91_02250 [Candidatus Bathyarchaeia archaeon]